ncbi:putative F-box domain-containing protein [Medicago truncatula]|uniref:Putative F-box domain-containing protein n=1 Tax=Medicago truncatula TaxID=3880 RepID=A0A396HP10_MEDTR|nr:putative F-box domain-containing protein [Medicago truncatula]
MKRKKGSITPPRATIQRCSNKSESQQLCPYFDNLPFHLTTEILLKLPIKSLLICRCVCKIWNTLISEPKFAKLQFERAPISFMIRKLDNIEVSRNLYLLECEPE